MEDEYRKLFPWDRYKRLQTLSHNIGDQEKQMQQMLLLQQKIQENCLLRATVIGIGSGVLGTMVGTFLFSVGMGNVSAVEETRTFRQELSHQYRQFVPYIKSSIKNFAKLGFIYSLVECLIQKKRAKSDIYNALYAGCTTGALLSIKNGPLSATGGCVGFAAFSAAMERYQREKF